MSKISQIIMLIMLSMAFLLAMAVTIGCIYWGVTHEPPATLGAIPAIIGMVAVIGVMLDLNSK